MKKIKYLIVLLACLIMPFLTWGCDQEYSLDLKQETIQFVMGESYNPFDNLNYNDANVQQFVTFTSSNNQIFYITPNKMLVGVNPGSAALYVYYKNLEVGHCFVNVLEKHIQFNAPVNLTYDYQTRKLKWSNVYAEAGTNVVLASSFTVEISINNGTAVEHEVLGNSFGPLTEAGSYKVRVKTNGSENGIYLPSDYRKNEQGEYVYFNFVLMAQPLNLLFDEETSVLTWDINGNEEGTKYKIFVNDVNITGDGILENYKDLDISQAGTYRVYVEAVGDSSSFSSISEVLELEKFEAPELAFNNGSLTWTEFNKASGYEILLKLGEQEWTYQTETNEYDLSNVSAGTYKVSVRAIGDQTQNFYTGDYSYEYQFTKLPLAEVVFDALTNTFVVNNNGGKNIEIILQDIISGAQIISTSNNYVFDTSNTETYLVKARIKASDLSKEINGNFSTYFTLEGMPEQQLSKIKNLSDLELYYNESENRSFIGFTEIDENSSYSLLKNGEIAVATFNENTFDLGLTADAFTNSGTFNFELVINKDVQNETYFISKSSFLNIIKLSAPENLGLTQTSNYSNVNVEVKDSVNLDIIRQVAIYVNEANTTVLDLQQNIFNIKAKFLAKTSADEIGSVKTYYTSSDFNLFEIRRLASVQNLGFDYTEKEFFWNDVLNAVNYQIFIDGVQNELVETTSFVSDLDKAYTLSVYAIPESWSAIESGQTGYIFSKATNFNVFKAGAITNLHLTKDYDNEQVIASWTAPTGVPTGSDVYYDVYLNETLVTTDSITVNSYGFDNSLFNSVGNYTITIKVVNKNNEYFEPTNNNVSVTLSKLASALQIEKNLDIISAKNFDINKMSGVFFNEIYSETNTYDISALASGEILSLQVVYVGIFDKLEGIYCLDSNASTFTIKKLSTPTNLNLNNGTFSWETLDNDCVGLFNFKYYTITNEIKSSETPTTNLEASVISQEEFAFYVYESALTNWQTLNAGETGFINSAVTVFNVSRESGVSNLAMQLTPEKDILIFWNYSEIEVLNLNEDYSPEFILQVKLGQTLVEEYILVASEVYSTEDNNYSKIIPASVFNSDSDYTISLTVQSSMSLPSDSSEIFITKLNSVNFVKINVNMLLLYNTETTEISQNGAQNIVISGDFEAIITETSYDISDLQAGETYIINIQVSAVAPETISDNHYYIDSDIQTFVLSKIENLTPILDAELNKIVWEQRLGADYYDIQIETFDEQFFEIYYITDNFISINDVRLLNFIQISGEYKIYVKAVVEMRTINPNPLSLPALTGYVSNDYLNFVNLEKLSQAQNIIISANAESQEEVTISWDNVAGASNYEIWLAHTSTETGQIIGTIPASLSDTSTFISTTAFSASGNYFVWIKAKGTGFIDADISSKHQIVRLEAINQLNITSTSLLSWNQSAQIASGLLDFSYLLQLVDANNQLISTFGENGEIINNNYNLSANEWLNNYVGGYFGLKILVQGNGSSISASNNITTLSSEFYSIDAYKLVAPEIVLNGNSIVLFSSDFAKYPGNINLYLTIKHNGVTLVLNELFQGIYEIPNYWEPGEYEISAYVTSKPEINNLVKSQIKTVTYNKLDTVSGVKAEVSDPDDLNQSNITITWNAVQNAVGYDLYINGTLVESFDPIIIEETYNFSTNEYMQQAGLCEVQIQARADGYISSILSDTVTVIRLNAPTNAYADANAQVYWSTAVQSSADYTYTLLLLNNLGEIVEMAEGITSLNSSAFVGHAWITALASGNFSIKVIVKGNGSSDNETNTLTLSSSAFNISMYKFVQPVISVADDILTIKTTDTGLYSNNLQIKYSISFNGTPFGTEVEYLAPVSIPTDWEVGTYSFKAYVTAKSGVNNFITSNVASFSIDKLETVTGLEISATNPADVTQTNVTLSWIETTNATSYALYINDAYIVNIVPNIIENVCYFDTGYFNIAGTSAVQIQARADGYISSILSETVTVIRLKAPTNAYADANAQVYWSTATQSSADYTYTLLLLNNLGEIVEMAEGITSLNSSAFVGHAWITALASGNFSIKVIVKGNGSSDNETNTLTLSSSAFNISMYKFVQPVISVADDILTIKTTDTGLYSNNLQIKYLISFNGTPLGAEQDYLAPVSIPADWEAGTYSFTAYVTAKSVVNNFITSNVASSSIEKLETVTGLEISATNPADVTQTNVTLSWIETTNATSYALYINDAYIVNIVPNIIENVCYFDTGYFNIAGTSAVQIQARADGYISSILSETVTVIRLKAPTNAYADANAQVYWSTATQSSADYTYTLLLVNNLGEVVEMAEGITALESSAFVSHAWITALESGNFSIKVIVKGNGSSDNIANTLTLSSSAFNISMYKFVQPVISVADDTLTITTTDTGLYSGNLQIKYLISFNGTPLGAEQDYLAPVSIPADWEAGTYSFTAYVTAKSGVNNFITSNVASSSIEKLETVTGLEISATNPADVTQTNVTLSWAEITNATSYALYVNDAYIVNIVPNVIENVCYFDTGYFNIAGTSAVQIQARADGYISSILSETVTVIRLKAPTNAYADANAQVYWSTATQSSADYTYTLLLVNNLGEVVEMAEGITALESSAFVSHAWITALESGNFSIKVIVKGNGSSDNIANTLTLSSSAFNISMYKFVQPVISVANDTLTITTTDTGLYSNNLQIKYSISFNGTPFGAEQVYSTPVSIPTDWEVGTYSFTAYVTAKNGVNNFIKSNVVNYSIEKLGIVTGLEISATNPADVTQTNVTLSWAEITNATSYALYINGEYAFNIVPNVIENVCYFDTGYFNIAGTSAVQIQARADGYISSILSETVTVIRLNAPTNAYADANAQVYWSTAVQSSADYTYTLLLVNNLGEIVEMAEGITSLNSSAFVSHAWITALASGNFSIKVIVKGNGSSDNETNTLTLSSSAFNISMYKFVQPVISVADDTLTITTTDTGLYSNNLQIKYSISFNGTPFGAEQVYSTPVSIPTDWEVGTYSFTAYVTAKSEVNNFITSNVASFSIDKLETVTGLEISATNPADVTQTSITLSWAETTNATSYALYINGEYTLNIVPTVVDNICYFETEEYCNIAGQYEIKLVAKANDKISSDFSDSVFAVRLNPVASGYANNEMSVNWIQPLQVSQNFTFYLQLLSLTEEGYELQNDSATNLTGTTYADFANSNWLANFGGGYFAVGIRVIGNGSSDNPLHTATLSSENYYVNVLKLYAPSIYTLPSYLRIDGTNLTELIPSGQEISEIINHNFSVKTGGNFAKDAQNNDINNFVFESNYYYPNNWASGVYNFSAFSYPDGLVLNVIPSNLAVWSATRLVAPQNLHFVRDSITDITKYTSDEAMDSENYLSETLFFRYDSVLNSNGYSLINGSNSMVVATNDNIMWGTFDDLLSYNAGIEQTLEVYALGGNGNYINSPISSIRFTKLNKINNFYVSQGKVNWTERTNNSAYLIKATDEFDVAIRFWQSNFADTTSSYLNGILGNLPSGQISLNIKATGNVSTSGLSTGQTIILDSSYMTVDSEFFKLEKPANVKAHLGFLTCDVSGNAENYVATVYSADNEKIFDFTLENYTSKLGLMPNEFFVGYSALLHSLSTETLFKIKLQAISDDLNVIYSDYSEIINFKVLENANGANDIGLEFSSDGMLDKTKLKAYVSPNSYGLLKENPNNISVLYHQEDAFLQREKVSFKLLLSEEIGGAFIDFKFAALGSSAPVNDGENDFYYLTSIFTQSDQILVLPKPNVYVEDGIIKWNIVNGCEGYYVYINDNLYTNDMYTLNYIALPDQYGGSVNTNINIAVVAVSDSLTTLYSSPGRYFYELNLNEENVDLQVELIKLKNSSIFDIVDGALMFNNGLSGLDGFDETTLTNLLENFETIEDWHNLQVYLQQLLAMPVLLYSQYTGFTLPDIELCFKNINNLQKYYVTVNSEVFLKMTSVQFDNLNNIINICKDASSIIIAELELIISELTEPNRDLNNLLGLYKNFEQFLNSNALNEILELVNKNTAGWPDISTLFDELNITTSQIPSGRYELTIRQLGNDCDWLTSNFNEILEVYVPTAPGSADIIEMDGDFYLLWNEVYIPAEYNYSPNDINADGIGDMYIIYGEDASGNRYEILRTNGYTSATEHRLQINLTELTNLDILTRDIIKIYVVVAGDNGSVILGKTSKKLDVSILPMIAPYMDNGLLTWDSLVSAHHYEITATTEGYGSIQILTANTFWAGEELMSGITYTISIRAIGFIYIEGEAPNQIISYVLTGKPITLKLSKLNSLNVIINKYGVFEWAKVANAQGFMVRLADTDLNYVCIDGGVKTTYESTFEGYYRYLFTAMGTTGAINSSSTVYYLNSQINNAGNGLLAVNLPNVTNIRVEDGIIKFSPLADVITVEQEQVVKVVGYKLTISNGINILYSTSLSAQEFFTDTQGNKCFDFSNYGTENTYTITVQPYIYYTNYEQTVFENARVLYEFDEQIYHLLLGKANSLEFEKIAAPSSVKILDGQVTWAGIVGYEYVVDVFTLTGTILSEKVTTNSWWTISPVIVPEMNYYVKVKAYYPNCVYSVYTVYCDAGANPLQISKIRPLDASMNSYTTEFDENIITFDYPSGGLNLGFNLRYKTSAEADFEYVYVTDPNYSQIVKYLNNEVSINISKISDDIEFMYYQIQVVPLGYSNYLKSSWSASWEFSIPETIENVYYNATEFEYYWVHTDNSYSYIIKDEILDNSNNVVAVYKYNMKSSSYTTESYYKERQVLIGGVLQTVGTLSYLPSVSGYKHRVSVAVSLDSHAEYSLISLYKECATINTFNLFGVENDILHSGSALYESMNENLVKQMLRNNAYGTENNPYLINNNTDFANINYRLDRYNYTYNYSVELHYVINTQAVDMLLDIEETTLNYCFKQTVNLTGITASIGKYTILTGGVISYKNFNNTYDGNNYTISYSITAPASNLSLGLFYNLGTNAVVKNLKVNSTINFNSILNSIFTFGAVAGQNSGKIYNCNVLSITVQKLVDQNNNGVKELTFGGIVGNNTGGTIERCVLNPMTISLFIASNGEVIYAGGMAGKNTAGTIKESGNKATITVVSRKNAYVGGIAGSNSGSVTQVYNKSAVSASTLTNAICYLGGLVGLNNTTGSISNSYNTGTVTTTVGPSGSVTYLGGLAGYTLSINITNCYSTMPAVQNQGTVLIAGTLVGHIAVAIPAGFTLYNYYINDSPAGSITSGSISNFAKKVTSGVLLTYANVLNTAAGSAIFVYSANYPCFVWE